MREPRKINRFWTPAFAGVTALETFYETLSIETPEIPSCWEVETFEKCSISLKIKAHADFNHRNILNISRIKIRMQRRDWAKGGVFQKPHSFLDADGCRCSRSKKILSGYVCENLYFKLFIIFHSMTSHNQDI